MIIAHIISTQNITLLTSFLPHCTAPHYSAAGELIYAGADLKTGGVLSYYHDVIYLCIFSQAAGAWTNWAWLALALVPAYAAWALVIKVLLPSWGSKDDGPVPETELERKRREKKERQAARAEKFARRR